MFRRFVVATGLVCLLLASCAITVAQAPPSADAYVTTAMPSSNFGSGPILPVQAGTTSYVQLNLGAFPANAKIAKATLRLYVDAVTAPGTCDVYAVNGNWSEHGVTASNAPMLGTSATGGQSVAISKASVNQFVLVDITALVQGWLDGTVANNGVALALTSSSGSFAFDSKESSGHHPELEVVLAATPLSVASATGESTSTATSAGKSSALVTANGIGPLPPSSAYIDNGTTLQTVASFNIDGTGTAATFNATSGYQLNGTPTISISGYLSQSLGYGAGPANTGNLNTFAGVLAGSGNTTGAFNTVMGAQANAANTTGSYNTIVGAWAGLSNTGTNNAFYGAYSGYSNTSGVNNMFFGTNAGHLNTTGNGNFFLGAGSGYNNTTGNNNTFLGYLSGQNADATASNNLYVGSQGQAGESGTIRIGDPASQTAAYIAGVNGASTTSGVPVFVDSTGKLGTTGGNFNFTSNVTITGDLSATNTTAGVAAVTGTDNNASGVSQGVAGITNSNGGAGVLGKALQTTGTAVGVVGVTNSAGGFGVKGVNTADGGIAIHGTANYTGGVTTSFGVMGTTANSAGGSSGVRGIASSTTGLVHGVHGTTNSSTDFSYGAGGNATSTTGQVFGVSGVSNSTSNYAAGVSGYEAGITGQVSGVSGTAVSTTNGSAGVNGNETATSGVVYGVFGGSSSSTNYSAGVSGNASAATGSVFGVAGSTGSTTSGASGVNGYEYGASGSVYGVYGSAASSSNGAAGVSGYESSATGNVAGVMGGATSTSDGASAVLGWESGTMGRIYGLWGGTPSAGTSASGVGGVAASSSGIVYGVSGQSYSSTNGAAGVFGLASATSGIVDGVFGTTASPAGAGGVFQNTSAQAGAPLLIAQDANGTTRFAVDNQGNVNVTTGTSTQVTSAIMPVNHARTTLTISGASYQNVVLTWNFAFPDTNYTANCNPQSSGTEIWYFQIASLTATTVTVQISSYGVAEQVTVHCMAVHD